MAHEGLVAQPPAFSLRRWTRPEGRIEAYIILLLALFGLAVCYPFAWLIFSSFKTGADIVRIPIQLLPENWTLTPMQWYSILIALICRRPM